MKLERKPDWPERLAEQVALAQSKPYEIGVHDCLRFSCLCIDAVTGVDFWPKLGGYTTTRGAVEHLATFGSSLRDAAARVLDIEPTTIFAARRGDILVYQDKYGQHLGVCTGGHVAVLGRRGLELVRLDHDGLVCTFRIG